MVIVLGGCAFDYISMPLDFLAYLGTMSITASINYVPTWGNGSLKVISLAIFLAWENGRNMALIETKRRPQNQAKMALSENVPGALLVAIYS